MTIRHSFPGPTALTTTTEGRQALAGLVYRDSLGNPRPGVLFRHANALVTARADMKVDVASFEAISVRGGPLWQANDGTVQVTIPTAPVSNSRYDVIYSKQNESAAPYSDGNDNAILDVLSGAASASPSLATVVAALPAGAVPIAAVLVPTGKTATNQAGVVITQIFNFTALTGTPIPVRTSTERDALINVVQGTQVYRMDLGYVEQYYAVYNASTNPTGAKTAGWYPPPDSGPRMFAETTVNQPLNNGATTLNGTAFAAAPAELVGMTSFVAGALTVTTEGEYDVTFNLGSSVSAQPQVWVGSAQKLTGPGATQGVVAGVVKCAAGDVITFRTFTSSSGTAYLHDGINTTQVSVKWRGVRAA